MKALMLNGIKSEWSCDAEMLDNVNVPLERKSNLISSSFKAGDLTQLCVHFSKSVFSDTEITEVLKFVCIDLKLFFLLF